MTKDRDICDFLEKAANGGFNVNGIENGEIVPAKHGWGDNTASHAQYTAEVTEAIEKILPKVQNEADAAERARKIATSFIGRVEQL